MALIVRSGLVCRRVHDAEEIHLGGYRMRLQPLLEADDPQAGRPRYFSHPPDRHVPKHRRRARQQGLAVRQEGVGGVPDEGAAMRRDGVVLGDPQREAAQFDFELAPCQPAARRRDVPRWFG